jgi:uncharacterized membrane protein HdeD (DUF308 family)
MSDFTAGVLCGMGAMAILHGVLGIAAALWHRHKKRRQYELFLNRWRPGGGR